MHRLMQVWAAFGILCAFGSLCPTTIAQNPRKKPAITALAITPDGAGFVHGSQAGVFYRPWNSESEKPIPTQLDNVHHLTFAPDGTILAVAGGSPGEFGAVELWSWPEHKLLGQLEGHDDLVYDAAWLGTQKVLVTASADRTIRVWDAAAGNSLVKLTGHSGPVLCLAVSPNGKLLCSGSADQTIRVWDTTNWQLVRSLTNHLGPVHSLAFVPAQRDGLHAVPLAYLCSAGGDNTVRVWQPEIGRMVRIVQHPSPVLCVAGGDGQVLYCGSKDSSIRSIDANSGEILGEEKLREGWIHSLVAARQAGKILAGDSMGQVHILVRKE